MNIEERRAVARLKNAGFKIGQEYIEDNLKIVFDLIEKQEKRILELAEENGKLRRKYGKEESRIS